MAAVLELERVAQVYGSGDAAVHALRGVDLAIDAGEYVAIMGPSGSGKSSLMNLLGCLDVPTSGRYLLEGQDVTDLADRALASVRNRRIGFVFQQFNLVPRMTARENVELPLVYAGVRRAPRMRRASAALEAVGLQDRGGHRPTQLSGGQQQRVAIARALVTDPAIVLADEPTGNLDSASTEEVLGILDALARQGRTIVVITHEEEVGARAARVVTLRDGRITGDTSGRPRVAS